MTIHQHLTHHTQHIIYTGAGTLSHMGTPVPFHPWRWCERPWQRIHVDFAEKGKHQYLVLLNAYSCWPGVMCNTMGAKTIELMRSLLAAYGLPEEIVLGNGPQFVSGEFLTLLQQNAIKHTKTLPHRGAVLTRFFELHQEIETFMYNKGKEIRQLSDVKRLCDLRFLYDITEQLNNLNVKLQGCKQVITEMYDSVKACQQKLRVGKTHAARKPFPLHQKTSRRNLLNCSAIAHCRLSLILSRLSSFTCSFQPHSHSSAFRLHASCQCLIVRTSANSYFH
ncbi:GT2D2 protein, partial [Polyodon spathula]|nr:GT2D2 protein [Polyodon spathula]